MKKTTKKLSLNRETVRELDQSTLNQAQGGAASSSSVSWTCTASYAAAATC